MRPERGHCPEAETGAGLTETPPKGLESRTTRKSIGLGGVEER